MTQEELKGLSQFAFYVASRLVYKTGRRFSQIPYSEVIEAKPRYRKRYDFIILHNKLRTINREKKAEKMLEKYDLSTSQANTTTVK